MPNPDSRQLCSQPAAVRSWPWLQPGPLTTAIAILALVLGLQGAPIVGPDLAGAHPQQAGAAGSSASGSGGLQALYEIGGLLEDRNADGFADYLAGSVRVPEGAGPSSVAAAVNLAARLGFETASLDLPLPSAPAGAATLYVSLAAEAPRDWPLAAELGALEPGRGLVALAAGASPGVVVAGGDGAGLRAATSLAAARLPYVWDLDGATLGELADALGRAIVGTAGADLPSMPEVPVEATRLEVEAGREGLALAVFEVRLPDTVEDVVLLERVAASLRERLVATELPGAGFVRALRVELVARGVGRRSIELAPEAVSTGAGDGGRDPTGARPEGSPGARLELAGLFAAAGLLGDSDDDLIPDRTDVLVSPGPQAPAAALVELGARLGLESAGVVLPLALPAGEIGDAEERPTLVLVGQGHPLVERLRDEAKLRPDPPTRPGEGSIEIVPRAFGEGRAVVLRGADPRGLAAAVLHLARLHPWTRERGKDRPTLEDVADDVRRFLSGRSAAGQAATAVYRLDRVVDDLTADLGRAEEITVRAHVEDADPGLAAWLERRLAARLNDAAGAALHVEVEDLDVQRAAPILDEEIELPSEVADYRRHLHDDLLPHVSEDSEVVLEARLSEPPELRRRLEEETRRLLVEAGADPDALAVRILSAYKQGFSWLREVVGDRLRALGPESIDHVEIRFAESGPPAGWQQQAMYAPTRWLLELFPIDEVLAGDLGLPLERIRFRMTPPGSPTYEVLARDAAGDELLRETFEPRVVLRPFFDRFPDYERVRVTTGGLRATIDGRSVVDVRIATDPERFWDHFQGRTLPAVYDYVMELTEGEPDPDDAPFFGELRVEVALSEPDYPLGIDQEQIAPMEALHEEIYFNTLHYFDVIGRFARGRPLSYPGRVIPVVRPRHDGGPGRAHIRFTGFRSPRPRIELEYDLSDHERPRTERRDILPIELERPQVLALRVAADEPRLRSLHLRTKVDHDEDRRAELVRRARAEPVDRLILSAEQVESVVGVLADMRAAGLYRDSLAWDGVGTLSVAAGWEHEVAADSQRVVELPPNGEPPPAPDVSVYRELVTPADGRLVHWREPIPPPEAYGVLAHLAGRPEATVYRVGHSYLGREVWAMDLQAPLPGSHASQAKATTLKPTVVYTARQHANEVSSTSHVLRLAEMLLTDPEQRRKLQRANVVIHPITNPDGAQLAHDLYRITPRHMLHAGYLGSLGVDVTAGQWDEDPIYPESSVRPRLWRTWRPDLFLNPHGYPSHEWVQLFSEYAAWVRNRVTESRDWWGMRGWFMPSFAWLDDPDYPRHRDAAFEIRDRITDYINALPAIRALNDRAYARYRRYGFDFDPVNFKQDYTDDVLIYTAIQGDRAGGDDFMTRNPKVTIWSGTTEAPDETASGDWLELVASAGLQWDLALLDYLVEGDHRIERRRTEYREAIGLSLHRARPPEPAGDADEKSEDHA